MKLAKTFKPKKVSADAFGFEKRKPGRPKKKKAAKSKKKPAPEPPPSPTIEAVAGSPEPRKPPRDIYAALSAMAESTSADGIEDPTALMDLAISADLDPSVFTEESFPVAPNVIEFCRGTEYLGFSGELWPRQVQILARFFADVCYFCSDAEYVHDVPVEDHINHVLDRFVLLQHGICPKCKRNRTEMLDDWIKDPRFAQYNDFEGSVRMRPVAPNEFTGVWGQRAGKSFTIATFAFPYILHRYLALPNPPRYFNRPKNIILEAAFVAPTVRQINDNIWMPFREAYESAPWFREVKRHIIEEGKRVGVPLYHAAQTFILFPGKRISLRPLAANTTNLRGATRIFATLDELGWFNHTEDGKRRSNVKDGTEVFNSLSNSLVTIRTQANKRRKRLQDYNALDAYMFNISSPCTAHDPIMQRHAVATENPRMYATHFATWDVNPDEDEDTIREQKAGDPESYKRDFCAIPSRALSPYFPDQNVAIELVEQEAREPLFTYKVTEVMGGAMQMPLLRPIISDIRHDIYGARIMAVDNGEVSNSFALGLGRFDPDIPGVAYEEFLEVAPYRGFHVDLAWCYDEVILPLVEAFRPLHVVFDRWNSAHQVIDLRTNHDVNADRYTLKPSDYREFKNDLLAANARFPVPEVDIDDLFMERVQEMRSRHPRAHFILQLTTVEQFGNKPPVKPNKGTDDLFRTAALMHAYVRLHRDDYLKHVAGRRRRAPGSQSVGIFRGASERGGLGRGSSAGPRGLGAGRSSGLYYNQ